MTGHKTYTLNVIAMIYLIYLSSKQLVLVASCHLKIRQNKAESFG